MRTHTCGELNKEFKDQEVTLCGWVHRRRDHGKLIFIDIRDRYGITQVVFVPSVSPDAHDEAQKLGPEFVVKITGTVNVRPPKNVNPDAVTGDIELLAKKLEILNTAKVPVFEIDDNIEAGEDLRLTYRYLDIRRKKVRDSLLLRHNICSAMRSFLNAEKFTEIETPVLTKSTPEGARDFLVPSRLTPGSFYALPQAPQQYKQLLQVAGLEKYFQIARCFRDEDLRADRQPEFTQIDVEASFVTDADIQNLIEGLLVRVFKEAKDIVIPTPFPRITYREAMDRYGSDKPDTRFGAELVDLGGIFSASQFKVFRSVM